MTRIFCYALHFFILVHASFESDPNIKALPFDEFKILLESTDYTYVSITYNGDDSKSLELSRIMRDTTEKLSNFVKFVSFDCSLHSEICKKNKISELPTIKLYVPQGKINSKTGKIIVKEKHYSGKMTGKHIGEFISENIPFFGSLLCDDNYDDFLSENLNKVILFKNKENIPLSFKGLSSKFRGNLEFAVVQSDCNNITNKFSITEYPTIIVIEGKESLPYLGKHEFTEISSFLKQYASKNKIPIKISEESASDIILDSIKDEEEIVNKAKIIKASEFKDEIGNMQGIVIAMFYEENIVDWWNYAFKFYQEMVTFVSVKCKTNKEREICSSYGAKSFPTIRLFPANKERKSYKFEVESPSDIEGLLLQEIKPDFKIYTMHEIETLIAKSFSEGKAYLLSIGMDEAPFCFKAAAGDRKFKDFVRFAFLKAYDFEANKYFDLTQYPTTLGIYRSVTGELAFIEYKEDIYSYSSLYKFIDEKLIESSLGQRPDIIDEDLDDVEEILDMTDLKNKCIKGHTNCIIALLDPLSDLFETHLKALSYAKTLTNYRGLPTSFVWVDGICQHELRENLEIKENEIPRIVLYDKAKEKVVIGDIKFERNTILEWVENFFRGYASEYVDKDLKVVDRECSIFRKGFETEESTETKKKTKKKRRIHLNNDDL